MWDFSGVNGQTHVPGKTDFSHPSEALMKERDSRDKLGVAWQLPNDPPQENLSPPIPGTYFIWPCPRSGLILSRGRSLPAKANPNNRESAGSVCNAAELTIARPATL